MELNSIVGVRYYPLAEVWNIVLVNALINNYDSYSMLLYCRNRFTALFIIKRLYVYHLPALELEPAMNHWLLSI